MVTGAVATDVAPAGGRTPRTMSASAPRTRPTSSTPPIAKSATAGDRDVRPEPDQALAVGLVGAGAGPCACTEGGAKLCAEAPPPESESTRAASSAEALAPAEPYGASACASCATLAKRAAGSFSRQHATACCTPGGVSGRCWASGGGASCRILASSSGIVSASKGGAPERSSYTIDAERPHVRARVDVARRAHLLGRHVAGRAHDGVRLRHPAVLARSPATLEIPKSSTFTQGAPSGRRVRNRFAGLRSRCTMPERVRLGERLARLQHVVDRLRDGHRPRARSSTARGPGPVAGTP